MADAPPPPPPPAAPLVPWRQHFGDLWRGGLKQDLFRTGVVIALPLLAWGAVAGWRRLTHRKD